MAWLIVFGKFLNLPNVPSSVNNDLPISSGKIYGCSILWNETYMSHLLAGAVPKGSVLGPILPYFTP